MEDLVGERPAEVLELLQARGSALANRVPWNDGRKLGLVVEGGGMRGVLSAGSLLAIDLMGFRNCFDCVFAVSAGSVNAAYFLSGQGAEGITVYFDEISGRRFINPWRFWKVADVDFVYDHIVRNVKPLDEAAVRASTPDFYVTAADVDTGKTELLNAKDPQVSVAMYLKASSALPVVYNRSVAIGRHRYMDGGIGAGLPIPAAIERGCTDILVLVSRPLDYVSKQPSSFEKRLFFVTLGLFHPALYRSWCTAWDVKEHARGLALGTETVEGVRVATISPASLVNGVNRMTIDRSTLITGAYETALKTLAIFKMSPELAERAFSKFI